MARERASSGTASPSPPPSTQRAVAPRSNANRRPVIDSDRGGNKSDIMAQIAERKARIAAAVSSVNYSSQSRDRDDDNSRAHGGLNVGVHPTLLSDTLPTFGKKKDSRRPGKQVKKQLELLTGPPEEEIDPTKNPFYDPKIESRPRERVKRSLVFNQKGKYVEQANALRAQARLEELKKRIQETSKKAGLEEEFDVTDMALKVLYCSIFFSYKS